MVLDKAIEYIENNDGCVLQKMFLEEFEPIGHLLIVELLKQGKAKRSCGDDETILYLLG